MKYFLGLIAFVTLVSFHPSADIYSISLKSITGNNIDLSQYRGKKMLFVVLPVSSQDTTITIGQISQLQTKYQSSLVVIGIPSEEAGYQASNVNEFKKLYQDAGANFTIAEGMKVKKGSGQSSLFQWLTSKEMNHHFDQDAQGVGSKFFVDEGGELYAAMGPQFRLTNLFMDRIITRPQVKKQ